MVVTPYYASHVDRRQNNVTRSRYKLLVLIAWHAGPHNTALNYDARVYRVRSCTLLGTRVPMQHVRCDTRLTSLPELRKTPVPQGGVLRL
jgi:hypothetical protein